jgi:hypothetical protein
MTYKQFIQGVRDQADFLEQLVKDSQVINMNEELGKDDAIIMAFEDGVEEFMDNVTGLHGHTIGRRA